MNRVPWLRLPYLALVAVAALLLAACGSSSDDRSTAGQDEANSDTPASVPISGFSTPQVVAAAPDGDMLYVAQNDGKVVQVSTPDYRVTGSWASGVSNPLGIAVAPDGKTVYLSNRSGNTVVAKNADSGAATGSWSTGSGTNPTGIGLSPDGATMYVPQNASAGTGAHKLTVRKAGGGAVLQTWDLGSGSRPRAAVVSPDGATAYVSFEGGNRISVRDTSDGTEKASWPLADTGFSTPGYLALSKDGDKLYVGAVSPSGVLVLDTRDGSKAEGWTQGFSSAFGVTAADCGQTVFVANATDPGTVLAVEQPNQCQDLPSAPTITDARWDSKGKYIEVDWLAPSSEGSSPITGYTATATDKDTGTKRTYTCESDADTLTCRMDDVKGGPHYEVVVTATNASGTGPASEQFDVKTGK
ncbi:MAG: fibronectin type III domain-containing protein [Actinobacteria bacterium]|nr:fibronectin type III domain-containing protein [Actinomycetota bacterium]